MTPHPLNYDEFVHLDAETLAEQGILEAYRDLLPRLREHAACPVQVVEEIDHEQGRYIIRAGTKSYLIYDDDTPAGASWDRATVAFFDIVNAGLGKSAPRFYALYCANDLGGMFLTEEQCAAARRAYPRPSDWPWMPVDEPPGYGFPGASPD